MDKSRIYSVRGRDYTIKRNVRDQLIYLNKSPGCQTSGNDKRYVQILLLSFENIVQLKIYEIRSNAYDLIRCKLF